MNPFHISFDPSKPEFWIAAGLVIFLGIFVLIAMRTIKRPSEDIRAEASLPLLDDAEPGHNPGQH